MLKLPDDFYLALKALLTYGSGYLWSQYFDRDVVAALGVSCKQNMGRSSLANLALEDVARG